MVFKQHLCLTTDCSFSTYFSSSSITSLKLPLHSKLLEMFAKKMFSNYPALISISLMLCNYSDFF